MDKNKLVIEIMWLISEVDTNDLPMYFEKLTDRFKNTSAKGFIEVLKNTVMQQRKAFN